MSDGMTLAAPRRAIAWRHAAAFLLLAMAGAAAAHGVAEGDKQFLEQSTGPQIGEIGRAHV